MAHAYEGRAGRRRRSARSTCPDRRRHSARSVPGPRRRLGRDPGGVRETGPVQGRAGGPCRANLHDVQVPNPGPDAETRLGPYLGSELTARPSRRSRRSGRVLRATHLDEIPQLWNVMRGDMSIVGPRPIRPPFFVELCERIPQYWQRLVIRPGVTGFAQTRISREETWADKLAHDMEYIADRSVRLYIRVIMATVWRVVTRLARREEPPARSAADAPTGVRPAMRGRATLDSGDMCGICGLMTLDGSSPEPAVLREMSRALADRGPDSEGIAVDGPVGLAVRRLAIIDLEHGDQPIADEDGRHRVVQNGEIYNYRELRARTPAGRAPVRDPQRHRGPRPPVRGAGPRFVHALRGMFAIAIWDPGRRRLVLARDRFGIKPLYYRVADDQLSFGSELKALLRQPGFERRDRPRCRRELSRVQLDPVADDDLPGCAQAPRRPPARP